MTNTRLCLCLITLLGCSRADTARRDTAQQFGRWVAEPTGIGPVTIGMTAAAARTALGAPPAPATRQQEACEYLNAPSSSYDVRFMVEDDTVVRYDVRDSSVKTAAGVGVGDSEAGSNRRTAVACGARRTSTPGPRVTISPWCRRPIRCCSCSSRPTVAA